MNCQTTVHTGLGRSLLAGCACARTIDGPPADHLAQPKHPRWGGASRTRRRHRDPPWRSFGTEESSTGSPSASPKPGSRPGGRAASCTWPGELAHRAAARRYRPRLRPGDRLRRPGRARRRPASCGSRAATARRTRPSRPTRPERERPGRATRLPATSWSTAVITTRWSTAGWRRPSPTARVATPTRGPTYGGRRPVARGGAGTRCPACRARPHRRPGRRRRAEVRRPPRQADPDTTKALAAWNVSARPHNPAPWSTS